MIDATRTRTVDDARREMVVYWTIFSLGLIWTVQLALRSQGAILDDEIGHFVLSRDVFTEPRNLLNLWGRPINTLLYAIPSLGGLAAARVFSVLLAAGTVLAATGIARAMRIRYLFLVPAFLWFQPWFNDLSYGVLTEVPFALLLAGATYMWAVNRFTVASWLCGLLPLTRHEGIALTGLWFAYMVLRKDWKAALASAAPMLAFASAYWIVFDKPLYAMYLNPRPTDEYGRGDWLTFLRPLRYSVGAPVIGLSILGLWPALKRFGTRRFFSGFLVYFGIHAVVFKFGLYASGGYEMFILPIAPVFAILASLGLEWSVTKAVALGSRVWKSAAIPVRAAAMVPLGAVVVAVGYGMREDPRLMYPEANAIASACSWLRANGFASRPTVSTSVHFYYFFPQIVTPENPWTSLLKPVGFTTGTVAVWDRHYSDQYGLSLSELSDPANGWRRLASFGPDDFAIIFEKTGGTASAEIGARVGSVPARRSPATD